MNNEIAEGQLVAYRMENGNLVHLKCRDAFQRARHAERAKKAGIGNFCGIEAGVHAGHSSLRFATCEACGGAIYDAPRADRYATRETQERGTLPK